MAEELARCSAAIIRSPFVAACPNPGLQLSIAKLKIVGIAFFLGTSWGSLKKGPNKTP